MDETKQNKTKKRALCVHEDVEKEWLVLKEPQSEQA